MAYTYDVIVVGDDECAIATAIGAIQTGRKLRSSFNVALLMPGRYLAGISGGTLGSADIGKGRALGGLYRNVFAAQCGSRYGLKTSYKFGCGTGEDVYRYMLAVNDVRVFADCQIDIVNKTGLAITSIQTVDGRIFNSTRWADGGRFGDLLRRAVPEAGWTIGREASTTYNESFAGFMASPDYSTSSPLDGNGDLWSKYIRSYPALSVGDADGCVQSTGFRVLVSNELGQKSKWASLQPPGYNADEFVFYDKRVPTTAAFSTGGCEVGKSNLNEDIFIIDPETGKPYHWEYPISTYERRVEIEQILTNHVKGKYYYLATDARRAGRYQDEMQTYGLSLDEFTMNGNFPRIPYMREGCRMVGDYVLTQADTQEDYTKEDSIAVGGYALDIHFGQAILDPGNPTGFIYEGSGIAEDRYIASNGYAIPYRITLPKVTHCTNMLVPYCASVSHVVWGSYRIITTNFQVGESAGRALAMSLIYNVALHDLDTDALRAECLLWDQVIDPSEDDDEGDPDDDEDDLLE